MLRIYYYLPLLVVALLLPSCEGPTADQGGSKSPSLPVADSDNGGIQLSDGFGASVFADTLGIARHIVVSDAGDVYVKLGRTKNSPGIIGLRDSNGDGKMDQKVGFGSYAGTGIDIHGGYLYASSDVEVFRYKMGSELMPDTNTVESIVSGFPQTRATRVQAFYL